MHNDYILIAILLIGVLLINKESILSDLFPPSGSGNSEEP